MFYLYPNHCFARVYYLYLMIRITSHFCYISIHHTYFKCYFITNETQPANAGVLYVISNTSYGLYLYRGYKDINNFRQTKNSTIEERKGR